MKNPFKKSKEKEQRKTQKKFNKLERKQEEELKKEDSKIDLNYSLICPIRDYSDLYDCYITEFKGRKIYMDYLKIISIDGFNNQGTPLYVGELFSWQNFYELYSDDIKILALNFPVDISKQKEYIVNKMLKSDNPQIRKGLEEKVNEFDILAEKGSERIYYLEYFSTSFDNLVEKKATIMSCFSSQGSMAEIDKTEKIEILHKINNPLSLIENVN